MKKANRQDLSIRRLSVLGINSCNLDRPCVCVQDNDRLKQVISAIDTSVIHISWTIHKVETATALRRLPESVRQELITGDEEYNKCRNRSNPPHDPRAYHDFLN